MKKMKFIYIFLVLLILFTSSAQIVLASYKEVIPLNPSDGIEMPVLTLEQRKTIQKKLKKLGYYNGEINGKIGSVRTALNKFYEDKGITKKNNPFVVGSSTTWNDLPNNTQTAIAEATEKGLVKFERTNPEDKSLMAAIKDVKRYTAEHGFKYCYCRREDIPLHNSVRRDCITHSVFGSYIIDCSGGVNAVLFEYAKINKNDEMRKYFKNTNVTSYIYNIIGNILSGKDKKTTNQGTEYFTLVNKFKNAKAGDILVYDGHVEIYAGEMNGDYPMVWNWGSNSAIKSTKETKSSRKKGEITYILRVKELK